jgi:hypothetical protein
MLKLVDSPREPFWLDLLPGVRLKVRPVSLADVLVARAAAAEVVQPTKAGSDGPTAGGDTAPGPAIMADAAVRLTRTLALRTIIGWEGIGDADGKPVEPSPDRIDQLLELWPVFEAFDRLHVAPALIRDVEKNV